MEGTELPSGLATTALGVAMVRAIESSRPDRLFNDPYAQVFVDAVPGAFAVEQETARTDEEGMGKWGALLWAHVVVRTRFFDDYLLDAARKGIRQVVLLAAGLDMRALRLSWPDGVRLYEVDQPEVLGFKDQVLAGRGAHPSCERIEVGVDLRQEWGRLLVAARLRPREPTAWLAEGVLTYLSDVEATRLLAGLSEESGPGCRLAFECDGLGSEESRAKAMETPAMDAYTSLWKGGLTRAAAVSWLTAHGWDPEVNDEAAVAASYDRTDVASLSPGGSFVTASRRW
jgi:methyltransferase (TIGR00027 family)